jgi:hypothetical protein
VVPTGFSLIRFGISEPVTKTVLSFDECSPGLSASVELEKKTTAIRLALYLENNVLIANHTTCGNTVQTVGWGLRILCNCHVERSETSLIISARRPNRNMQRFSAPLRMTALAGASHSLVNRC